jgi:putative hydrolase of the HAD superfamily
MVGNNLARDVRGANAAGIASVWLHLNERYPSAPVDDAERPRHEVRSFPELAALLAQLG